MVRGCERGAGIVRLADWRLKSPLIGLVASGKLEALRANRFKLCSGRTAPAAPATLNDNQAAAQRPPRGTTLHLTCGGRPELLLQQPHPPP